MADAIQAFINWATEELSNGRAHCDDPEGEAVVLEGFRRLCAAQKVAEAARDVMASIIEAGAFGPKDEDDPFASECVRDQGGDLWYPSEAALDWALDEYSGTPLDRRIFASNPEPLAS